VAQFVGTMNFLPGEIIDGDRVRVGGLDLRCDRIDGTPVGTEVQVCLRPEDVAVRNLRDETPNRTLMAVEAIEFLGSFCRATLASPEIGGPPLIGEFSINAVREMGIEAGGSLTVALPPERLLLFRTPTPEQ
jgi:iron(III) transport system ATP-binding protein